MNRSVTGTASPRRNSILALAGFVAGVVAAASLSAVGNPRQGETMEWYDNLDKPSWNPPKLVFPLAWTTLYGLIAYSGWRVWHQPDSPARTRALALWGTQLAFNAAWTPIFFTARRPKAALVDSIGLFSSVVAYQQAAKRVDPTSGWMMAPYVAWTGFATALNAEIVRRNPDEGRATTVLQEAARDDQTAVERRRRAEDSEELAIAG